MGKWIGVKDRLPRTTSDVLVAFSGGLISIGAYNRWLKEWSVLTSNGFMYPRYPTHWRHMVKPPPVELKKGK